MAIEHFPKSPDEATSLKNPAIQLFGNRLFSDQTVSELLVEFLLVVFSPKCFNAGDEFHTPLPPPETDWNNVQRLQYGPKARLNLKLFSFLGASRLDSRHQTHRSQHEHLLRTFREKIQMAGAEGKDDVIQTIENLLLGFQGAGSGRTWCAQSFLPVCPGFLAGETIWNETKARGKSEKLEAWDDVLEEMNVLLTMNKHRFLGRGGELQYLQICNALRQPSEKIASWVDENGIGFTADERNPAWVWRELDNALAALATDCPKTLTDLAEFIDTGLDSETSKATDTKDGKVRFVSAGWCNADSWREGYLFAVEVLRLLRSNLDVVDRIYLLETACAMQALRTLAAQSARANGSSAISNGPAYRLALSSPEDKRPLIRRLSQQCVKMVEKSVFQALRGAEVELPEDPEARGKTLKQADSAYGSKLFVGLSKRIGFIVPKRGTGARFVLNEQILRFLVITTVPLGGRLTYDTFKVLLEQRHGLVVDSAGLERASCWLNGKGIYLPGDTDQWLQEMLAASGNLIRLSDSCALVHNSADAKKETI